MAFPHTFASLATGNVPASFLDDNFNYLAGLGAYAGIGGALVTGYTPPGIGASATTVAAWLNGAWIDVVAGFGADPTGLTDSTARIQAAATAVGVAGGGVLHFPPGTFMINQTIKLSSNTIVQGSGRATLIKANPTYVGINGGTYATFNCHLFGNVNYAATVLTDHDIVIRDLAFDWGSVLIAGGGAFSISMHFVSNVTIENVSSNSGDNVTALLSCLDTVTFNCHGVNCRNAYFDDWGGASSIKVLFCTGRTNPGFAYWDPAVAYVIGNVVVSAGVFYTASANNTNSKPPSANWTTGGAAITTLQGIQFTGLGSFADPGQATNCISAFNELYGIQNTLGTSSAYISNSNAATSSTVRYKTFGNYAENCDNAFVVQGALGQALSVGDMFRNCRTGSPIFFNTDASGSPSNCRVISPTLIDCGHVAGNIAMIVMNGTNNRVENVSVINTGAALYTSIVWFPVGAVNCYASISKAPTGSGARVNNQSTTSLVLDRDDMDAWPYPGVIPTIASANTIAPTLGVTCVSGATTVKTITVPAGCASGGGRLTLISLGTWVWDATGNIQMAGTPVLYRPIEFYWLPSVGKWFPSYVA